MNHRLHVRLARTTGQVAVAALALLTQAAHVAAQPGVQPAPSVLVPEPVKSYRGYALISATLHDQREFDRVLAISGDCWTHTPRLEAPIVFLVPPGGLEAIRALGITFDVVEPDMQAVVDAERERLNTPGPRGWYDDYKDLAAISDHLDAIIALRPDIASRFDVGQSLENRTIFGVRIDSPTTGPLGTIKPVLYLHATQHAREWVAPMTVMYIAEQLVSGHGTDAAATALLDKFTVIIVPVVNVDGYVYTWTTERYWRKNRKNNGNGTFGVDLNRNWGFQWGSDNGSSGNGSNETYRGTAPFSEPETTVLRANIIETPGVVASFDVHTYGQLILSPWGYTATPPSIISYFDKYGKVIQGAIKGVNGKSFVYGPTYTKLYPVSGGNTDWWFGDRNVINWTLELRGGSFSPPATDILPSGREIYAGLLAFGDAFCRADVNRDTFVNGNDYDAFADQWIDGLPGGDYDRNGFVNGDDFDAFVAEFEEGC